MQIFQPDEERLKVAIIGTSGSGKTCFIAAMRWLGECGTNARFISEGANGDSKNYLDDLHKKVNAGEVPPGTPKEFKLEFSERYASSEGKPPSQIDFSLRDFKGGNLSALDANSPLLQSWTQCDLLMVLLDIENVQKQGTELQDNLRDLSSVLMRKEMDAHQKRLAVVVTQADKGGFSEERHAPEEAEAFLNENLPVFFERIKECRFKETKCFLLASIGLEPEIGADGKSRVPEVDGKREWHPFGYEELFDWICAFQNEEASARFWAWFWAKFRPCAAVLAVLALGGVVWRGFLFHQQHNALLKYEGHSTLEEKAEATWKMKDGDCIDKVEERIRDYNDEFKKTSADTLLRFLLQRNKTFREKARISEEQETRFKEIDTRIADRLEENLFERIKGAMEHADYDSACKLIGQYRTDRVISRKYWEKVESYANKLVTNKRRREKLEIASYDVKGAENTSRMEKKLKMISEFIYPNKEDKEDARYAVAAMQRLMQGGFTIQQIRAEELEKKRKTYILIETGVAPNKDLKQYAEDGEGIPVRTEPVDNVLPQWNDERLGARRNLSRTPGKFIRVEWRRDCLFSDKCIASIKIDVNDWIGLLRILQPQAPMESDGYANFKEGPKITIKCKEFPEPAKDLDLIERYVIPGTYWREQ